MSACWDRLVRKAKSRSQMRSSIAVLTSRRLLLDGCAVDDRAIAAMQVLDEKVVALAEDLGMLPTDGGGIEHDVAIWMPSEDDVLLFERVGARFVSVECLE